MSSREAICHFHVSRPGCDILPETRLQWVRFISEQFMVRPELDGTSSLRDWDLVLSLDGSGENRVDNTSPAFPSSRLYPAQYRIPTILIDRLGSSEEKVKRAELFALGGLLYEVDSGEFPEDVWKLPSAVKILACWCPRFAEDLLDARRKDNTLRTKAVSYIAKHPIRFSLQVTGGIVTLASLIALPILGAVGFGVVGPAAGSAAAAWQSSIGLVEAGSFFAWCQSAAMGGAAVGGILASGFVGAGVAVTAALVDALDDVDAPPTHLKERFLAAWNQDISNAKSLSARL